MAKEAGKPKVKKKGSKAEKSQGRPKFCPNSTKSFNLSTTRSNSSGNTWSRGAQGSGASPPRQLSTVRPMVTGHAISRPRIQLERVDLSSMTVQQPGPEVEEVLEDPVFVQENVEEEEEVPASPLPAPTRNVFDLTNIREESTLMDDSVMNAMEETVISPSMEAVVEENLEDMSHKDEAIARRMTSTVAVDFICIAIVAISYLLLNLVREPYMRGFFCKDESIRHPYRDDSVPTWALILVSFSLPAIIIALVETVLLKHSETFTPARLARETWNTFGLFVIGSMVNQLLTDTSKFTIGRLRPHFMEVCNPNINMTEAVCGPSDAPVFVTNFTCLGQTGISDSERRMRMHDMRLSWVSGHASLSAYGMWFCIVFLHQRMSTRNFRLVRPLTQVVCALFAVFTSLTRVSDYKHHAEDVASGAILGLIVSSLTVTFLLKNKNVQRTKATSFTSLLNVTTDIAAAAVQLQQNIEVRLENQNVSKPRESEPEKPAEPEGRARRQRAGQVSYKELSVRQKMRQGDAGSSSIYGGFKPLEKEEKKKKKVSKKK